MDTTDTNNADDTNTNTATNTDTSTKCYLCPYCSKVFNKPGNRTRHQNNSCKKRPEKPPPKTKPLYQCTRSHCQKTFDRQLNRDRHSAICMNTSKQNLKTCFICKKEFSRATHLRRHLEIHSAGKHKKIKCENCNSIYSRQDKYDSHLRKCRPSMVDNNIAASALGRMFGKQNQSHCSKSLFVHSAEDNIDSTFSSVDVSCSGSQAFPVDHADNSVPVADVFPSNNQVVHVDSVDNMFSVSSVDGISYSGSQDVPVDVISSVPVVEVFPSNQVVHVDLVDNMFSVFSVDGISYSGSQDVPVDVISSVPIVKVFPSNQVVHVDSVDNMFSVSSVDGISYSGSQVVPVDHNVISSVPVVEVSRSNEVGQVIPLPTPAHSNQDCIDFTLARSHDDIGSSLVHVVPVESTFSSASSLDIDHKKFSEEHADNNYRIAERTKQYLKVMLHRARYSIKQRIEVAKFLVNFFGEDLKDIRFSKWLAKELHIADLKSLLEWHTKTQKLGRPVKITKDVKLKVQECWRKHSVISVDRRNMRNNVKVTKQNVNKIAVNVLEDDTNITKVLTKRGWKYKADRYISTKTQQRLYNKFISIHGPIICYGYFVELKPFYIFPPTSREKESCLCKVCLNIHVLYDTVRFNVKGITFPSSLSAYIISNIECDNCENIDFPRLECLSGTCGNKCSLNTSATIDDNTIVSYYQFEQVITTGYNKEGKKTEYSRTARIDKKAPLKVVFELLNDGLQKYIVHRYFVISDKVFWAKFRSVYRHPILTFDYSENIQFKPKFEAQSAHFSGKQQTLHCCVQELDGTVKYLYHLSDDKHHDSIMTFAIIHDIIENDPSVIENGHLVLRSDNCPTQYKSKYIFQNMKTSAQKYDVQITWFYGEPGHGRGLVDAMSCFGCKGPLRNAIITEDRWFDGAGQMKEYLDNMFMDDPSRSYFTIDPSIIAKKRRQKKKEHPVKNCRKMHMISVAPNGEFTTKMVLDSTDSDVLTLNFDSRLEPETIPSEVEVLFEDTEDESDHEDEEGIIDCKDLFSMIYPETFIGLQSPPKSIESFYVVKVISKGVADENLTDRFGHTVLVGEQYISGYYLNRSSEGKNYVKFSLAKKPSLVYIHVKEVFSIDIELSSTLTMDIKEFHAINQQLY